MAMLMCACINDLPHAEMNLQLLKSHGITHIIGLNEQVQPTHPGLSQNLKMASVAPQPLIFLRTSGSRTLYICSRQFKGLSERKY
jgi:hypothetical protein